MMERIDWLQRPVLPRYVAFALHNLAFDVSPQSWPEANDAEWDSSAYYLHRNQLTLLVHHRQRDPRFDAFYDANRIRLARLRAETDRVVEILEHAGLDPVLFKGFARIEDYVPDSDCRMHYDIDLLCPHEADAAVRALAAEGYKAVGDAESQVTGHLPPMVRPTSWKWRGDFFDAEIPAHVEIHRRLWTPEFELFGLEGVHDSWSRRERNGRYLTLSRADTIAHRSMHLLRHLLRGDFRAAGVYEIAWFLHSNRADDRFWTEWDTLHAPSLKTVEGVGFALAQRWFGCELHPLASSAIEALPSGVRHWMLQYAASPAECFFTPNKHELALHLALLDSFPAKARIAARRLLPFSRSTRLWESRTQYLFRMASRAGFHARALANTILTIRRWNAPNRNRCS
jgi:hypothetical protein